MHCHDPQPQIVSTRTPPTCVPRTPSTTAEGVAVDKGALVTMVSQGPSASVVGSSGLAPAHPMGFRH